MARQLLTPTESWDLQRVPTPAGQGEEFWLRVGEIPRFHYQFVLRYCERDGQQDMEVLINQLEGDTPARELLEILDGIRHVQEFPEGLRDEELMAKLDAAVSALPSAAFVRFCGTKDIPGLMVSDCPYSSRRSFLLCREIRGFWNSVPFVGMKQAR